ncbi:MAG: lytic transglycosylase domain-containing protein [Bacteroidetes bacterium]|nr:lytic transglycosylase domain-containing protein [Bacteroidota bacterium]
MENVNLVRGAFIGISFLFVAPTTIGESTVSNSATKAETSVHRHVKQFVTRYINANREDLQLIAKRSLKPFAITDEVFRSYKLPVQLKYLAVIESELKTTAVSKVGAVGPWQLMPETARDLGLKVDSGEDERTHYYKSTKAAAKYLKDLYAEFGDWLLVLAAYNGGPKPVYHAMKVSGSRNFWTLQAYLPAESRMHVKRYIATYYYFERNDAFIANL